MLETMTAPTYNYYNPIYPGMQYQQIKRPTMSQPLTPEQMQLLASKGGSFSTRVAQEDIFRSVCTHKKDGNIVLVNNGDGTFTCPICQETFSETDLDPQHVKDITREMINILQMIKTTYMDIPDATALEFFPIITLLEKTPELAEIAMRNFSQYEQGTMVQNAANPYSFNALNSLMGGPMAYPGMQPNMYQQQMAQPQYQQQPQFQQPNMYQQPMAPAQLQVTPQHFNPINEFGAYNAQQQVQFQQPQYQQQMAPVQVQVTAQPQYQQQPQPLYQPIQPVQQQPQQAPAQQVQQQAPQQAAPTVDTTAFTL